MPTYEYRCKACGHQFEIVQSFADDSLTECGRCGSELRKVFSPVGISFKGSGFYRTDSRAGATKTKVAATDGKGDQSGDGTAPSTAAKGDKSDKATGAPAGAGTSAASGAQPGASPAKSA